MLRAGARQTFAAFGVPAFRLHWACTVAAFISFMMSFTVQSVITYDLTGSNASVAFVAAGSGVAWFFVGPIAGALADRLPKRRLLVIAQTLIAINFGVLAFLVLSDDISVLWLTASSFLLGSCFAFTGPTRRAYVADLVPRHLVGNGVVLLQSALNFPQIVGPAIAAGLISIAFVGSGGAYVFMFVVLSLTILSLGLMPQGPPRNVLRRSVYREIVRGLRYAASHSRIRLLLGSLLLISVAAGPYQILLPGLLENALGVESVQLGLLQAFAGIGSFTVGVAVAGVVGTRWSGRVMYIMAVGFGLGVLLLGMTPSVVVAFPIMFLLGAGFSAFQAVNTAEVLIQADPEYHGRLTSLTFVPFGVQSMAGLAFGNLADGIGERSMLMIMGISAMVISAVAGVLYQRIRAPARTTLALASDEPRGRPAAASARRLMGTAARKPLNNSPPAKRGEMPKAEGGSVPTQRRGCIWPSGGAPFCHSVTSPPAERGESGSDLFRGFLAGC